jgi:hypothetical protein
MAIELNEEMAIRQNDKLTNLQVDKMAHGKMMK